MPSCVQVIKKHSHMHKTHSHMHAFNSTLNNDKVNVSSFVAPTWKSDLH